MKVGLRAHQGRVTCQFLLPAIQPDAIDWTINLRRWNMSPLILRVEFATAKISPAF